MSETSNASVLLVGGPDSGKSNYLFRLWLTINSDEGCLVKDGLPDQLDYLKAGAQALLSGDFAQRTQHDVYNESVIPVQTHIGSGSQKGRLIVPDCWGERWVNVYRKREWSVQWESHISSQTGYLVFVRAGSEMLVSPLDWIQCQQRWGAIIGEGEAAAEPPIPTQVILTEWLQFFRRAFLEKAGSLQIPRVGIVVAAWDSVPDDRKASGPTAYIETEFPLLYQFIMSNDQEFEFEVFGVSIAGGDLQNEPGFKQKCLEQADPLSGGYVIYENNSKPERSPDLSLPVAWAMGYCKLPGR